MAAPSKLNALRRTEGVGQPDGATQAEVAVALGITRASVGNIEQRALAKLRALIEQHPERDALRAWLAERLGGDRAHHLDGASFPSRRNA